MIVHFTKSNKYVIMNNERGGALCFLSKVTKHVLSSVRKKNGGKEEMLKKAISWLLVLALLCSGGVLFVFAEGQPANDAEAVTAGYHFKVTEQDGTVTYGKFAASGDDKVLNSVESGSTVTLIQDVGVDPTNPDKLAETMVYLNGTYTIDGNGHSMNVRFRSDATANVTVKNANLLVKLGDGKWGNFYQINANNSCTFDACTFVIDGKPNNAVIIPRGNLTLKDSSFKYVTTSSQAIFFNETNNYVNLINTTFDLSEAPNAKIGVIVGVNNKYHTQFAMMMKMVNEAADGSTLSLADDFTVEGTGNGKRFELSKKLTVEGNGHVVKAASGFNDKLAYFLTGADVVIRNLNFTQSASGQSAVQVQSGATVTVENSTLSCEGSVPYGVVILCGKLILNSGAKIITKNADGVGVRMHAANSELIVNDGAEITTVGNTFKADASTPTTITINGGKITTGKIMWGGNKAGLTLIINGGVFISQSEESLIAMYNSNAPVVKILGGNFTAKKIVSEENKISAIGGTIVFNEQMIYRAPTEKEFKNNDVTLRLPNGGVASRNNAGIRFTTVVDKAWYDAMVAAGVTVVRTGTLIAPKAFVDAAGAFTPEALKAAEKLYLDIGNNGWYNGTSADDFYFYYGNMVNLSAASISGELAGIGYMVVTVEGLGTFTVYGTQKNGTVKDIAAKMLAGGSFDSAQTAVLEFFRGSAE